MVRRKFSAEFKMQVIQECLETGNISIVARKHDVGSNVIGRWVREYKEQGAVPPTKGRPTRVTDMEHQQLVQEHEQIEQENDQLKKLLGEKDLEIAVLRDLVKKKNPHLLKN
ncbi:transposase [Aneurinibacillus sp. Ricciae_BoGa-3]|uniref:transposase n=1 Tax=Aneurinibacillus sp. Ricciae_BoGa-3 TaxID=3022697 RepID=UPI0023422749|nr:transposase [Aneurinibacillus sp. Ricciae_BoGa-3]WCK54415.1 transposase [Aneurinibacillus sp. Ricciae_BoGa-3]